MGQVRAASLIVLSLAGFAVGLSGCKIDGLKLQPSSIVVEARAKGRDGVNVPVADAVLSLRHDANGQEPRLVYRDFGNVPTLKQLTLAGTTSTGLPFQEEWHFLVMSRQRIQPGSDVVPVIASGDHGWVRDHMGELAWLVVRHQDRALPSDNFSAFQGVRSAGMMVLARREDDDRALPWVRNEACTLFSVMPMTASLRPPPARGAPDCFDMQSFTSAIFNHTAVTVEDRIADLNNSTDPVRSLIKARVVGHRISFVPHVPAGGFPGFGFIYQASIEADFPGLTAASLTISVPISLHWMRDAIDGRFSVNIDPLGPALPGAPLVNASRIAVSTLDGDLAEGSLEDIRRQVVEGVQTASMPTGPLGIPFDSLLSASLGEFFLPQGENLPANFSVLALPEDQEIVGTPSSLVMRMGPLTVSDTTVEPGQPGGLGARNAAVDGDGRVVVLRNRNATGTSVRSFRLPAPTEVLPIRLYMLR